MRLPRARFTVRRMMIMVAFVALLAGATIQATRWRRLREEYLRRAWQHAEMETFNRDTERAWTGDAALIEAAARQSSQFADDLRRDSPSDGASRLETERVIRERAEDAAQKHRQAAERRARAQGQTLSAAYHLALKRKYLRAASRPWFAVEPDPPPHDLIEQAACWLERHDYLRAESVYSTLIKEDPYGIAPIILGKLARLLATCPDAKARDGRRAVEIATDLCEKSSWENESEIDLLAAAHAECGDFKKAIEYEQKAIRLLTPEHPNLPTCQDHLRLYVAGKPCRE